MIREMMWHIFHKQEDVPLVWDGRAIEFTTEENAIKFWQSLDSITQDESYIKHAILYYDDGYINLDNKQLSFADNGEEILIDIK